MRSRIMIIILGIALLGGSPVFAASGSDSGLKGFLKRCIEWVKTTFDLADSSETAEVSDTSALAASTDESSSTVSTGLSGTTGNQATGYTNRKSELLSKFDADGDGKLSKAEMANAVEARKQEMLTKYDADGDGTLNDSEKETMRKQTPRRRGGHGDPPLSGLASGSSGFDAKHEEFVKRFDTDGDGTLSDTEKAAADAAREQEMLTKYDADGDGTLNDSEKETMRKQTPRRPGGRGGQPPEGLASGSADFEAKRAEFVKKFDTDGDGTLSDTEKAAADQAREQEVLTKYDADGDGALSDSEKATMMKDALAMGRGRGGQPPTGLASGITDFEAKRAEFVKKFDTDGDGTLSETEKAAADLAREQEMLAKYDADGDGVLSDSEKSTMMKDTPAMGRGHHGPPPPRRNASDSEDAGIVPETDMTATSTSIDGVSPDQGVTVNRFQWRRGAGKRLSKEQSEARKKAMIDMFDENGDGILQESEQANAKSTFQGYYGEISEEADE